MKVNTTFKGVYACAYIPILMLLLLFQDSFAQSTRVYATTISNQSNTDFSGNAVDENLTTRARVRASSGLALGIGAYSGNIELQFPALLPANTTSYIKIQTDDDLLPSLLGGSLGGLLADVTGAVLIGNQEFTVQAKNNSTVVLQGDSQEVGDFATNRLKLIVDTVGNYYVAITPSQAYNRVRLTNRLGSLIGLFNVRNLDVYDAFYISDADECGAATYTSFSGSGINLDLLNLGNAGVDNPENAIDNNPNSFSRLSLGIIAVAASIEQTAYFEGLSGTNDQFNIRMKIDPSLLALGVANNIQIVAWNGPNVVQTASLNSLLNLDLLTLLQGNQVATIGFAPPAPADRITIRYNSLLNVQLTQSLDLYDIIRVAKAPAITDAFTLDAAICAGSTASLVANTETGYEIRWYANATGGSPLAVNASGQPFVTPVLTADTSFYVAAAKMGCPEESQRIPVDVEVIALPAADDVTIVSDLTACQGNIILIPSSSIGGAMIKYYTSQDKTTEITTGYAGDAGVTYFKDNTSGALTITGLNAVDSPYSYFISLTVDGLCENTAGTLKEVTVVFSNQLALQLQDISGCGSVNLRDAILNFDPSNTYFFFDAADAPITAEAASEITASGNYSIQAQNNGACLSDKLPVTATVSPQPGLVIANSALVTTIGNSVTLDATATGTITWYDAQGNALPSNIAGPFANAGTYTFTAVAVNGLCADNEIVTVTVLDPAACPPLTERNYADAQTWSSNITGGVFNAPEAVDGNIRSYSTIVTGIGLLGIGTTWQTLQWNETITAGTPVTLKLGSEYSGLTLVGGFSVIGTKRNGSGVPIPIGNLQPVSGALLDLLPGQNTFEYTFVPANNSGPQNYDGVRIVIGSLLSVAQNAKVFEAYYNMPATQVACDENDAQDVLYGAVDLGVGAATATVGVDNPYDAIDDSQTSYATMFSGAGILAAAEMTVVFRTPSVVSDTLKIRLSRPSTLLTASALTGIFVQPMLHNADAGPELDITSSLLTVRLINGGQQAELLIVPNDIFDRVRIRFGGVLGVLDFIRVHNVARVANTHIDGAGEDNAITACQGQTITLEADAVPCTTFIWYDAATGGNVLSTGNAFTVPADLPQGTYTYYIQPVRYGCEFMSRGTVTLTVTETAPEDAIADVTINGGNVASFCSETGSVTFYAVLNATITITNPVFYWYSFDGTTQTLIAGESTSTLAVTGLTPGTYTYFAGISSDEYCETAVADRTEVTITILPPATASDIQVNDVAICLDTDAVLAPASTLANPVFTFYFTNDTTQPITNGLVVGAVTYTISNGVLTISGLTEDSSPYTYFVAVTSDTTCLNEAGNLEPVAVIIGNLPTPTTTDDTQNFCITNNPTVADIQVNETGVIFYDAAIGGNIIPPSTALTPGIYYATLDDGVCESISRLAITVTIGVPPTPTTNNNPQNFCLVNNPTVADIQVNETGVVFYDAAIGGNLIDPTTPLTAGIYYATIADGACESLIRLAITITISNPAIPTTSNKFQDFCQADNPTVSDIQVNEPNVAFYNIASGGTALALTDALVTGIYYVALVEPVTNCESVNRLEIAVTVTTVGTPTTNDDTQNFCLTDSPTVADIQVNEPNVVFYDDAIGGNLLAATVSLVNGIYYASLVSGICESEIRLAITVTIGNPGTPTTNNETQTFCQINNPTVADIQVNELGVIFYDALAGGNVLAPTTPLVAGNYYAVLSDGLCESKVRLVINAIISNPGMPTTNDISQDFCLVNNPTVADIQINEPNVIFYDAAFGGNVLAATDALVTGVYYAVLVDPVTNCEGVDRLKVLVEIISVGTPTTNNNPQHFCQSAGATVADIQINETGIVFYDAPTGGNQFFPSTLLTAGIYYAAIVNVGCESEIRLAVTITIGNPAPPTTNDNTQDFCASDAPTVADIQINETGVLFYDAPTGGNLLAVTTPLVNGNYYAAATDGICESATRLEIVVSISNPGTPTTNDPTQDFCASENPTVADLQVNETGVVFFEGAIGGIALDPATPLAAGTYYAALTDGICTSSIRLAITVQIAGSNNPDITGGGDTACYSESVTYTVLAGMENYLWAVTGGTVTAGGGTSDNTVTVDWDAIGNGIISVSFATPDCPGITTATRVVLIEICSDITITKTVDNLTPIIDDNVVFTITVTNNGVSQFINVIVNEQLPNGYQYVSAVTTHGSYSTVTGQWLIDQLDPDQVATMWLTARVMPTGNYLNTASVSSSDPEDSDVGNNSAEATIEPICLTVYNEFSPNGDGDNETFRIDCIENYPNNTLQVHNRYGVEVYNTSHYMNLWDGTANVNSPLSQDNKLPSGTYYYILELGDGNGTKTGWLHIIR